VSPTEAPGPAAGLALPVTDPDLEARLRGRMDEVEKALYGHVQSRFPFVTEAASHLLDAGGKRFRPLLVLLAAEAGEHPNVDDVVTAACVVEITHVGSLYHDDVMDDATTRRTVESVNARWGNLRAILAGDFLLARASEIAAGLGPEVAGLLAATIARLCEGQIRELQDAYNVDRSEAAYVASIEGKTAALFASSCRIGALVAGFDRERIECLTRFGRSYGMAFQVIDDVLDVVASSEQLGKPAGHDLVEGVYTLPTIRALQGSAGEDLAALLGRPVEPEEVDKALGIIRADGAVTAALVVARSHVEEGRAALDALGSSPVVDAMAEASDVLVAQIDDFAV
jgi:heptaprenyl diphosphate synthase